MNTERIQEIYNRTFPGLRFFYRDTAIPEHLISKYEIGQILMEPRNTDMSSKGGGLTTNCRYLIASAHAKDLSALHPDDAELGHFVLPSRTFFKVLDIYKVGDQTQILVLEIPEAAVDFFETTNSNIEENVIQKARENFETKLNAEPIAELQPQEWKERTEQPIGMDDERRFFYDSDNIG